MKIKFLTDYTGRETAGKQCQSGDVVEIPTEAALELIRFGLAEEYEEPAPRKRRRGSDEQNEQ